MRQLRLTDVRRSDCPFSHRLENDDYHCNSAGINAEGYDLVGEDSGDFALRLAEVNGIDFDDITIANPINPVLPLYVPTVPKGSGSLFRDYGPKYAVIGFKDVVSAKELKVTTDVHAKLGVPKKTKVILHGFGKDKLLELAWPPEERNRIITEIAKLDLYAVIPSNYSIWDDQPHAERFINQKRSMITYRDMMEAGLPAIPHIYWCGKKDLDEYVRFLDRHPALKTIAIDMQTLGQEPDWQQAVADLRYFASKISTDIRCFIVGPSTPSRINQIIRTLPNVTIINSSAAQAAVHRRVLADDLSQSLLPDVDKTDLMRTNDAAIHEVVANATKSVAAYEVVKPNNVMLTTIKSIS